MERSRSPFSVNYRKPIIIKSTDPRIKDSISRENFRSKAGRKIIVREYPEPTEIQEFGIDEL